MEWNLTVNTLPEVKKPVVGYWPPVLHSFERVSLVYNTGRSGFFTKEKTVSVIAPTYWAYLPGDESVNAAEDQETVERVDFLASVIVTAVEGGINYWAEYGAYQYTENKEAFVTGASVDIRVYNAPGLRTEPRPWHLIDIAMIRKGIQKVQEPGFQINPTLLNFILAADRENDGGNIDSEAADCIVQAALFGELVYG